MFFRVRAFSPGPSNMFVLDMDANLQKLQSRTRIGCDGIGPKSFSNPVLITQQTIFCVDEADERPSFIVKQ